MPTEPDDRVPNNPAPQAEPSRTQGQDGETVDASARQPVEQATASYSPATASPPPKPADSAVPTPYALVRHPRYEILEFIGAGGMGTVYRARHRLMDRVVALKVINRHLVTNPTTVERFRREVTAAARLDHPNIVTAYDADQAGDTHFLVMEFVDGVPLDRVLAARGRLPVSDACEYAREVALGLQHAHERGMVHRDIKPHNLMLTSSGRVKILDFGLARYASEAVLNSPLGDYYSAPLADSFDNAPTELIRPRAPVTGLTAGYVGLGTADYMAPEEGLDARRADIRADIYSLGCTLYHFLAGQVPFPGGEPFEKLHRHLTDKPRPLPEVRDDVPPQLVACLDRMMAKAPEDRYQIPSEVVQALAPFTAPSDRRILLVEDDPAARSTMTHLLHSQGFVVDAAADGREALACLRSGPRPALIMLDLIMPVMDGWQFLREQKADPALADIPVIIVSGADPKQALAAALGAADYMQKPIDFDDLLSKVRRHTPERTSRPGT